jgi:DNA-directed RNA polymerase subunit RPC12/RpoP
MVQPIKEGGNIECLICKSVFPEYKEILIIVDRGFYCHHCWSRLISFHHGKGKWRVEEDLLGEKWKKFKKAFLR